MRYTCLAPVTCSIHFHMPANCSGTYVIPFVEWIGSCTAPASQSLPVKRLLPHNIALVRVVSNNSSSTSTRPSPRKQENSPSSSRLPTWRPSSMPSTAGRTPTSPTSPSRFLDAAFRATRSFCLQTRLTSRHCAVLTTSSRLVAPHALSFRISLKRGLGEQPEGDRAQGRRSRCCRGRPRIHLHPQIRACEPRE